MPLQPFHAPQPLLLAPPLLPPLVLRTENGFFGAKRPAIGAFGDCEPCNRFEEPPDPEPSRRDPGERRPAGRYVKHQLHEAVDLEGEAGDCVFAVYTGRVVEVERSPDSVTKGDLIAQIGSGPADPHLHVELRIVLDSSDRRFWSDRNSVALDPTRLLYRVEADALPVLSAGAASAVTSIGVETVAHVPFFRADTADAPAPYRIPLYEPSTEHERGLATVFAKALELGRPIEVDYRDSVFFGPAGSPPAPASPDPSLGGDAETGAGGARGGWDVPLGVEGTAEPGEAAMAGRGVAERRVLKVGPGGEARRARDRLAVEEPLELRVAGRPVGVTMRTPGNDFELAIGYCISERLVAHPDDVEAVRFCAPEGQAQEFNVLTVDLRPGVPVPDPSLDRLAVTSSSCGVCGKASIEAVTAACPTVAGDDLAVPTRVLAAIPERVREAQRVFEQTGGLHAAAVCDAEGGVLCVREDVGRHNAVDKVIGWAATERRLPLTGRVLFVSGRCSFEVVQKAAVAGVSLIAAVSAPSSLAVELAEQTGMTLVGFLRGDTMNVYTHAHRVTLPAPARAATPA